MRHLAIYPGSFDPPTLGHLDVIERASGLFDNLVVALGVNPSKTPFLSLEDRIESLRECTTHLENVRVMPFEGLLVHFAAEMGCRVLVRGLRAVSDFDNEFRNAMANRKLAPAVETLYLMTSDEYSFLASSVVREVALIGGDYSHFVPGPVARRIRGKLARNPVNRAPYPATQT